MSIRVRLVLSYLAMLAVPVVLCIVAAIIAFLAFLGDLKPLYQIEGPTNDPFENVMVRESGIYSDIKLLSLREPQSLLQQSVIDDFDKRLSTINTKLIIRVDQDIFYASPNLRAAEDWRSQLPEFGAVSTRQNHFAGDLMISRQEDFLLPDKRQASLFAVTDTNVFQKNANQYFIWAIVILLLILALTNGVLTYLVSRSIIRPLKALQRATEEIKEGNLDYEVKPMSRDEIGKLSAAFEAMRRRLKESVQLQLQYEENRKELVSNISHDLKTPVTAIKGYVEGIMDGVTNSPEKLDRYLKTIYTKTVHMDKMIDELFLYSKLDLGKLPFHFERVEIGAFVQDCAQEMHFDMEKKSITLEQDSQLQDAVFVKADREKLKRVLINILENAMKYMDKADGRVGIGVDRQEGRVVIRISDNGRGIPEESLPHIFDRFYRADPSRNQATGGSGLGLSIARQIVEEHGGRIWAESELGKGSTVHIVLPEWSKREGEGTSA